MAVSIGLLLTGCAEEKVMNTNTTDFIKELGTEVKQDEKELNQFVYKQGNPIAFLDYKITRVDENGSYFAESLHDDTGLYFNYEYTNEDFEVGDLVVATFDTSTTVDSLTEVYSK